ncbi:selenocysteine lyase/cysteine desulfurase [Ruminiclostridium sufflavum DSM 19573]|uniref:Selenocysteine lyase/cysteine desulfurase n=1 Tax=Ruminiclostridium sufflavum DSM 19573 TaxID=1121337 RepID=A0A318XHV8_9FIRM|nr:aminotransferase class V-fold PLP-dependent enzyme [Ruminiclostridium sufflavum]PYG86604.1 selenocysteine lyase/cysteine desulfurase [Ruminiclostridium sufflavum DSM 19573]
MIYFDNASTTKYKPEEVYKAFEYYVREIGVSPGRGSYQLGIEASRMLFKTRKKVAEYFGLSSNNVIFTKNSTEAINLFFNGFLKQGDHAIISCYEHNAVLRPLHQLKLARIIDYSVVSREDLELKPKEIYEKYVKENTVLFATTLASNLTGRIVFSSDIMEFMKNKGLTTFVDASQGAGKIRLAMTEQNIDYLTFTGHKDLMALPGVGGLCCVKQPSWKPLIQGGTGVLGDSYVNPDVFPEEYEAGTLNMPAIWSLKSALEVCTERFEENKKIESELMNYLLDKLNGLEHVIVYDLDYKRVNTVGFNLMNRKSNEVVEFLDRCGICTRGGIHCAILAHEALGTKESGVVRISMSAFNKKEEIDTLIRYLEDCR